MSVNTKNVQNCTNTEFDANLGQIRVLENADGIVIEHHVTERERFFSEYSVLAMKTAQATLEMCRVVHEAKNSLNKDDFQDFCKDIGYKGEDGTIRKYIKIGSQYDKLIQYTNLLPNAWTSIHKICQLPSETFDALAATDTDMSNMSGKQLKILVDMSKSKSSTNSACVAPNNSVSTTQTVPTNSSQLSNDDEQHDESLTLSDVEKASADSVNNNMSTYNNQIDVVCTDDTYEVLVRFKSKPSDDSWWDLTEAIEAVVDEKNLNVQIIENRPVFKVVA